jgi:hypothetical protein
MASPWLCPMRRTATVEYCSWMAAAQLNCRRVGEGAYFEHRNGSWERRSVPPAKTGTAQLQASGNELLVLGTVYVFRRPPWSLNLRASRQGPKFYLLMPSLWSHPERRHEFTRVCTQSAMCDLGKEVGLIHLLPLYKQLELPEALSWAAPARAGCMN